MIAARDQQIQALYKAALERPPAERARFIAQLSGADDELRRSVELLLSQDNATEIGVLAVAPIDDGSHLSPGTEIGHYRIDAVLGRGGMGVVYRATDGKLHRPVAIKFLSAAVADAEVRRRFEQEAETASSLNHPNIVTVYDVGEHEGRQYIVSELVDGGTLEDSTTVIRHRSWRQSVELLTGIADGLAAAHAAGVLHRDIKPGNILLGRQGYAKLADFGLAKLLDPGAEDPENRLRAASNNTRAGVVVGTIAYMSPEQAAGQSLDARSDIFSFGIVLYELLAGRPPFEGANELEVLKAIAHATPAPLPEGVPDLLRMAVDKALEKEPADRYQTMQDFVADLRRVTRKPVSQTAASTAAAQWRVRLPWLVAASTTVLLLAALVPALLYFLRPPAAPVPQMRFDLALPGLAPRGLAISPDGQRIAFTAITDGVPQIWLRPLSAVAAQPLRGTENASGSLFWSPDGRSLAFHADGKLKKIDTAGGAAQTLADVQVSVAGAWNLGFAGAWSRNGTILYGSLAGSSIGIFRVPAVGGAATLVTAPGGSTEQTFQTLPRFLPDGDRFLYGSGNITTPGLTLYAASLEAEGRSRLLEVANATAASVEYAGGFLVWERDRTLVAQPFDADALVLRGEPTVIAENVGEFSVADTSVLVYREASPADPSLVNPYEATLRRLVWFDRTGQRLGEVEAPARYRHPVLSPDGRRVAMAVSPPTPPYFEDIWTVDTARGVTTRLTFDAASDVIPLWSPDGTHIAFASGRDAVLDLPSSIYRRAASGAGSDEHLLSVEPVEFAAPHDWSRDGRYIVFSRAGLETYLTSNAFWILPTSGDEQPYSLIEVPFPTSPARFSPDGRWIAYAVDESNGYQVVVQPFPNAKEGKWQVSTRGGYNPRWSNDGRELFYLAPDGTIMTVDVRAGSEFETGPPRALFATDLRIPVGGPELLFDVSPDGRFLVNEPVGDANAASRPGDSAPVPRGRST